MLIDTKEIAERLSLSRDYVTDKLTKREDFPAPHLRLSRKTVKWLLADFERWCDAQAIRAAGRSALQSPGSTASVASSGRGGR